MATPRQRVYPPNLPGSQLSVSAPRQIKEGGLAFASRRRCRGSEPLLCSSGCRFGQRKLSTVIQIGGFVQSNELYNAGPQPRRGLKRRFMAFRQIGSPGPPLALIHL